jgi:hypothetical protein
MNKRAVAVAIALPAILGLTVSPGRQVRPSLKLAAYTGPVLTTEAVSPAGCTITYVSNPHISDYFDKKGVKAVKVNVKTQCSKVVPELTLSVTLIDAENTRPVAKTIEKTSNKPYILNEST